jgi:hypothetical protein
MTEVRKPKVALKVRRQKDKHGKKYWVVKYGRHKKDGDIGWAKTHWKIGPTSLQPMPVFHAIIHSIYFRTNKIPRPDKCFASMSAKIQVALSDAAPLCGCKFEKNKFNGRTWILRGKPYMDFAVVDFERHRERNYKGKRLLVIAEELRSRRPDFERMERKSHAMFRAAIVVFKNGVWKFVPGKTLPEDKRHG